MMKNPDDGRISPFKYADDTALAASIGLRRFHFDQHLVALHGAVDLIGRNEDILGA